VVRLEAVKVEQENVIATFTYMYNVPLGDRNVVSDFPRNVQRIIENAVRKISLNLQPTRVNPAGVTAGMFPAL